MSLTTTEINKPGLVEFRRIDAVDVAAWLREVGEEYFSDGESLRSVAETLAEEFPSNHELSTARVEDFLEAGMKKGAANLFTELIMEQSEGTFC